MKKDYEVNITIKVKAENDLEAEQIVRRALRPTIKGQDCKVIWIDGRPDYIKKI